MPATVAVAPLPPPSPDAGQHVTAVDDDQDAVTQAATPSCAAKLPSHDPNPIPATATAHSDVAAQFCAASELTTGASKLKVAVRVPETPSVATTKEG